jgi:RHS repeat-associated protein
LTFWNGLVLERYEYDAYGNPTIWNVDFSTEREISAYNNPYLFTGRRVDTLDSGSLKIQYNRNRYYDYYTGRWLTHDPLGITPNPQLPNVFNPAGQYKNGLTLYEYVSGTPLENTEPYGLFFIAPPAGPFLGDPLAAEMAAKNAAYIAMKWLLSPTKWQESLDHWFNEEGDDPLTVYAPDERCDEIKSNSGFQELVEAWVAKTFCDAKIKDGGTLYKVKPSSIFWKFQFPIVHAGGITAYWGKGIWYLGSYTAKLAVKKKDNCLLDIDVEVIDDKSWQSFCKTLEMIPGGKWCPWPSHARGAGPYSPSQGGTVQQKYFFDLEGVPIRLWPPCALCELPPP